MTYTFIGEKNYIEKEISKLSKDFNEENIVRFNLEEQSINLVIQELDTVSLFGNKMVIVDNINLIEDADSLIKYLEHESDNTLVLVSNQELDKRKKISKVIKDKTNYKEFLNISADKTIKDNLEDYKMSNMAINLLINYCSNNIVRIESELEKLKTFKIDEKEITKEDVELLVKKTIDASIFDLIDKINQKDKDRIFKIYNDLLEEGETEEKIMYTIANHYRLLYQISVKTKSQRDEDIIKEYKMHPYRLTKLKEQLRVMDDKDILQILKRLSDIDISIKKGEADIKNSMFLFFESL